MNVVARLNVGGPAVHVTLVTAKMAAPHYESRLVSGSVAEGEGDMSYYARRWGVEPVTIAELGRELHPVRDLVTLWKLYRLIRDFAPDVVHTNTAKAGTVGRIAARLARVPVVVHTFHGHVFHGYFNPWLTRFFIGIERLGALLSDRLITLSEDLRRDLSERYRVAPADRILVVRNGLDLDALSRQPRKTGTFRRRLGIPLDVPLIGIVGRMVPVKNHALFLEAATRVARELRDAHFALVGDGELRADVEARIDALSLRGRVTICGWVVDPAEAYADLDVNVLTSNNEGTPLTLIEALTAGVPVVATAVGGVPDLLEHGALGALAPPGDAAALATAILRAVSDPPPSIETRELVRRRYGIDRLVGDLDRLYRELLAKKRPGRFSPVTL